MDDLKLKVGIARFPYGGNGMSQSEHPDVGDWLSETLNTIKSDNRIELFDGKVPVMRIADTPITMTRNRAVKNARTLGLDILVMVDSDMQPDSRLHLDREAKPFWDSSFDFIYDNWKKEKYYTVAAPYCGGGSDHCPFIFRWNKLTNRDYTSDWTLEMYSRDEAASWTGIAPVAALPTGLIAFSMPCFELSYEPEPTNEVIENLYKDYVNGRIVKKELLNAMQYRSWFYYEYGDFEQSNKASTEDVTATRDISLLGMKKWGYNPIMCNWDAWAGHWKPELVDKPMRETPETISHKLISIAERRLPSMVSSTYLHYDGPMPEDTPTAQETVEEMEDTQELEVVEMPEPSKGGPAVKAEKRIEIDEMSSPPINDDILSDLANCARLRVVSCGGEVNCMVIGEHTGLMASVISDQFSGAGGRVLCIGDCVDSEGKVLKKWSEHVGDRMGKTVYPVVGDTLDHFQGIEKPLDFIFINTCGTYSGMASLLSRWFGLLNPGGVVCGTQHDHENYAASLEAVHEVIGEDEVNCSGSEFWWASANKVAEASN